MIEEIVKYIVLVTIFLIIFNFLGRVFTNIKEYLKAVFKEIKHKKMVKDHAEELKKEEKAMTVNRYFGLFEINVQNYDDEQTIKKDCCSIIRDKIKSKYLNHGLQINATDKIFFNCSDFSIVNDLVDDFVKLYNFFVDINKKRKIAMNLKFSLWAKPQSANMQEAYKTLSEINDLGFENLVVANDIFYKKYQKEKLNGFDFHPQGVVRLMENDEDIELYRLLKSSVSKANNE